MTLYWMGLVAASFGVLVAMAVATHIAFFFRRPKNRRLSALTGLILTNILFSAVTYGTSVVLSSSEIFSQLENLKLAFLSRFLFYTAVVWFLMVLVHSLLPEGELRVEDFKTD